MISGVVKLRDPNLLPVEWQGPAPAHGPRWGNFGRVSDHELIGLEVFNAKAGIYVLHAATVHRLLELGVSCDWVHRYADAKLAAIAENWDWPTIEVEESIEDGVLAYSADLHVPLIAGGEVY